MLRGGQDVLWWQVVRRPRGGFEEILLQTLLKGFHLVRMLKALSRGGGVEDRFMWGVYCRRLSGGANTGVLRRICFCGSFRQEFGAEGSEGTLSRGVLSSEVKISRGKMRGVYCGDLFGTILSVVLRGLCSAKF